jgi:hypothetical protein
MLQLNKYLQNWNIIFIADFISRVHLLLSSDPLGSIKQVKYRSSDINVQSNVFKPLSSGLLSGTSHNRNSSGSYLTTGLIKLLPVRIEFPKVF